MRSTVQPSAIIQGVPIHMEMTTYKSSLFHAGLFRKHNYLVSQLKNTSFGISKTWFAIFLSLKLTELLGNLSRFHFIKTQRNSSNVKYLRQCLRM